MSALRDRAPLLPPANLRRIRARCLVRVRRYRKNYPQFSASEEMYFFFGAASVLETLPGAEADALAQELFFAAGDALKRINPFAK